MQIARAGTKLRQIRNAPFRKLIIKESTKILAVAVMRVTRRLSKVNVTRQRSLPENRYNRPLNRDRSLHRGL
jgi:hypothetical protein